MTLSISRCPVRLALLLAVVIAAPASALADKKTEAKAHIAKASRAHKDGNYHVARVELEAAYALDPDPDLLYAIGQVHAKLGDCDTASASFKRFAATQNDPQVARVVEQAIAACKPAPLPPAATEPLPPAPAPAQPPQVAIQPQPAAEPPPSPPPPAVKPRATVFAPSRSVAPAPPARSPWYRDKLGGALVLGGVVASVAGMIEYRAAVADLDAAETQDSLPAYDELVGSARSKRTISVVLGASGGVLIAAGVVRYVLRGRARESRTVGVAPARGGGVVTLAGRF